MTNEEYLNRGTIGAALSYMEAKSIKQLVKETGLPTPKVRKEIERLLDHDSLDERDGYYRIQNAIPWKVKLDDGSTTKPLFGKEQ
jgi:hypothetical protein